MRLPCVRRLAAALLCTTMLCTPRTADAADSHPMTRAEVVAEVLAQNPDMRTAAARLARSESFLNQAAAAFYPQIGVYTEYGQGDAPSSYLFKTIDQRKLAPNTDFNNPGQFENWESGIQGQWNLFNGGRDWTRHRMAQTDRDLAGAARQEVINNLMAAAISGYYDVLAARDFARISEESVATVTSQLESMAVQYRAGGALKSDLLSLEVRLARAQEAVLRSNNRLRLSRSALAALMGRDPAHPPAVVPETAALDLPMPADVDEGARLALAQRPELARLRHQVTRSNLALQLAQGGYLPNVHLRGRWYVADPDLAYTMDRDNWTAAIVLEWALFSGFSTRAEHRGAAAELQASLAAETKTILSIKQDVTAAYLALDEATERLVVAEKGVGSATASFDLVQQQYTGGSVTITRYLDAELDLNRAKIQQTAARYDRQKAVADLGRAIGYWPRQERVAP